MMDNKFLARFFDGHRMKPASVWVEILPEGLKITYEENDVKYEINWANSSLQLMERFYYNKPAVIGSKSMLGARLIIENEEIYNTILPLIPKRNIKLSHVHHPWRKTWLLVAAFLLVLIIPIWQVHRISMWIANGIPDQLEQQFWKNMLEPEFNNYVECVNPEGLKALNKMVDRLSAEIKPSTPFDIKIINAPDTVNAESLPGFHIFIYSGLLKIDHPDAIAAVLAHEMGHSVYHHVIARFISIMGMTAFFNSVLGLSTHNVAFDFINLKYSRDYEIQADEFAIQTLKKAKINPIGFKFAMEYLALITGEFKGIEPYLVDHPPYKERLDLMKNNKNNEPAYTPSLTPKEWESLKNVCSETREIKFSK